MKTTGLPVLADRASLADSLPPGSRWRHLSLKEGGPARGAQRPNAFTLVSADLGRDVVAVRQDGPTATGSAMGEEPTRWGIAAFLLAFTRLP